ncbi:DUF4382 domain-containing protein [Halorussus salinisoli]|uniref:DUF4382 domain-containing protein n=1 Tax=Halorussus salinisoli TaxID=2558242 RepID=UPI0010C2316D|nr:DUF4382 domain-containing protein [Halorussus salinisoli]
MGRYAAVCIVVTLLLAGCVGGQGGTTTSPASGDVETTTSAETTTAQATASAETTASGGEASALNFYVSDEKNAMDDFAHLNVTVSKVGLEESGGNWTTHAVDNRTLDLTELTGANATRLGTFPVENGTYETVFVHVSEVNGTLTDGEQVRVKLPSQKLQIHQTFSVGANESVDYVFDISVFEAGKSGKYILKPVISESGTDEEIEVVGEDERETESGEREDEKDGNERDEDGDQETTDAALNASFVGNVTRGANATVSVTRNGTAVANATVSVNGEVVGETAADGTLTVAVPDRPELEVEIETENGSVELERELRDGDGEENDQGDGN